MTQVIEKVGHLAPRLSLGLGVIYESGISPCTSSQLYASMQCLGQEGGKMGFDTISSEVLPYKH